ncbi:5'-methylthioadenosine/S-adenosylhomocysteine nucleosidase [Cellulomonas sp. NPDC089187]|uniref:5'-methylthioadenosine/S-adenosylhomocysteine nucleosidase n=1 Tax=Cellulomonas sp. NPDC089187 TaxID=3154970 RepID=UPI00343F6D3F
MSLTHVRAVIAVAMPDEAAPFLERADHIADPVTVGGAEHHEIELSGQPVLLVRGGIGLANAASAASAALVLVAAAGGQPAALISAGSAGGVQAGVHVGEVVVGTEHLYTGADARAFGYALGQVPGMPAVYSGDPELRRAALAAEVGDLTLRTGLMLSGDQFVDAALVAPVREQFPGGLSTDMETTALAQVAHVYGVPFLAVRGISDLCGPAGADDFRTHVDDAADRSAVVVTGMLARLTEQEPAAS